MAVSLPCSCHKPNTPFPTSDALHTPPQLLTTLLLPATLAMCPMGHGNTHGKPLPAHHPRVLRAQDEPPPPPPPPQDPLARKAHHDAYYTAVAALDFGAVKKDLITFFTAPNAVWPADYDNYAPFFVRLAWHCSGSYRTSDGRGGCAGGRQRFEPERSWADNTNLDKARGLLWPLKEKYGLGLSWGDLFILAGTTAVEHMGGPILGYCAGRPDAVDGTESQLLGPTAAQEAFAPCPVNGECKTPLGSTTIGLIYLNPEGPMGQPVPETSAGEVRDTFNRMAMNDSETVALIGGGHAFGKTHGACPATAGKSPKEDPANPWPGLCGAGKGKGKGVNAWTSGFEGPWTTKPTQWDNEFFRNLVGYGWEKHKGPGDHWQWRVTNTTAGNPGPQAPSVDLKGKQSIMRLTSDVSLTKDPTGEYQKIVKAWAATTSADGKSNAKFDHAFKHAWYKLTTRDMGPAARCLGDAVPPPQEWQFPLPAPVAPSKRADVNQVRERLQAALDTCSVAAPGMCAGADTAPGRATYFGAQFVRLAYQCASTFRRTDYQGGCNGARLRFSPQKDWPVNKGLDDVLAALKPIKDEFAAGLSWADLIVLAGNVALEDAGAKPMAFCAGRTDASDGSGSMHLNPALVTGRAEESTIADVREQTDLLGLSTRQMAALYGRLRSPSFQTRTGFANATYTCNPARLSNDYFNTLLDDAWVAYGNTTAEATQLQYRGKAGAANADRFMLASDLAVKYDPVFATAAQELAADNDLFLDEFKSAWTTLMNADRFDGPDGNLCASSAEPCTGAGCHGKPGAGMGGQTFTLPVVAGIAAGAAGVVLVLAMVVHFACLRGKKEPAARRQSSSSMMPYSSLGDGRQ